MIEKRKFTRIEKNLITYHRKLWQTAFNYAGLSKNISLGGILVELDDAELKAGDLLSMEIVLPAEPNEINIIGRVVRIEGNNFGIEFVSANEKEIARLKNYIETNT